VLPLLKEVEEYEAAGFGGGLAGGLVFEFGFVSAAPSGLFMSDPRTFGA